tara:strand:+ start:2515 stop:3474 length:960 start_codon:yes stop_codon:yes gene_type:complete
MLFLSSSLICYFLIIFLIYKCLSNNIITNRVGYLKGHQFFGASSDIEFRSNDILHDIKYIDKMNRSICKLLRLKFEKVPDNTLFSYAYSKRNNIVIGSLLCYPWKKNLYIANNLFVKSRYRNQGIANSIIKNIGVKLVYSGSFGVFSSCYNLLSSNKLYELYWYKYSVKTLANHQAVQINRIFENELNFINYPRNVWFENEKVNIEKYIGHLCENGLEMFQFKEFVCGCSCIIDSSGDYVLHIKWYWGKENIEMIISNIIRYCENDENYNKIDYFVIPSCEKKCQYKWDYTCYYFYGKLLRKDIPFFSKKDKLGWFLDR